MLTGSNTIEQSYDNDFLPSIMDTDIQENEKLTLLARQIDNSDFTKLKKERMPILSLTHHYVGNRISIFIPFSNRYCARKHSI